jgi:hypothetical protein
MRSRRPGSAVAGDGMTSFAFEKRHMIGDSLSENL